MAIAKRPTTKATPTATVEKAAAPVAPVTSAPAAAVAKPASAPAKQSTQAEASSAFPILLQTEILKPLHAMQEQMQEQLRAGAEKGIEQFRAQYATLKSNAETATDKLEESIAAAQAGTRAFQSKVLDVFRAQSDANFTHLRTLFAASSLTDALKIQQDFAKAQADDLQTQTRALTELAQKMAHDVAEPVKASLSASFSR